MLLPVIPSQSWTVRVAQPPHKSITLSKSPSHQGCQHGALPLSWNHLPPLAAFGCIHWDTDEVSPSWRLILPSEWEKMHFGNGSKLH